MPVHFCYSCRKEIDENEDHVKIIRDKGKHKTKITLRRYCISCFENMVLLYPEKKQRNCKDKMLKHESSFTAASRQRAEK